MVKERRAFEVKSVQDTLPGYKPQLGSTVPVRDYTNEMEALQYRTGMNLMPTVFTTLDKINTAATDLGRVKEYYNELGTISWDQKMIEEEDRQFKINTEREQNNIAFQYKQDYEAQTIEAIQQAQRSGGDVMQAIKNVYASSEKTLDQLYNMSPFIADQFNTFRQETLSRYTPTAISNNYTISEAKKKAAIGAAESATIFNMSSNLYQSPPTKEDISTLTGSSVAAGVKAWAGKIMPLLDGVSDELDKDEAIAGYNNIIYARAEAIVHAVNMGTMAVSDGMNALHTLVATWNATTIEGKDNKGEDRSMDVFLTKETIHKIYSSMGTINKTRSNLKAIVNTESYIKLTGKADSYSKANIYNNEYFVSRTPEQAELEYNNYQKELQPLIADGNTEAIKAYIQNFEHYHGVVAPAFQLKSIYNIYSRNNKSMSNMREDLLLKVLKLDLRLKDPNDDLNNVDLAVEDEELGLAVAFGIPDEGSDESFAYIAKRDAGTPMRVIKARYWGKVSNTIKAILDSTADEELAMMLNPAVHKSMLVMNSMLNAHNLVTNDSDAGVKYINDPQVATIAKALDETDQIMRSATGKGTPSIAWTSQIKALEQSSKNQDPETKVLMSAAFANALTNSGHIHHLAFFDNRYLNADEQKVRDEVAAFSLISTAPGGSALIQNYAKTKRDTALSSITMTELDASKFDLEGGKGGSYSEKVDSVLTEYKIPLEHKAAVRKVAEYLAVVSKSQGNDSISKEELVKYITSNYKEGVYLHSRAFKNTPVSEHLEDITRTKEFSKNAIDRTGTGGIWDIEVNSNTGRKTLVDAATGNPHMALTPRGKTPMQIIVQYEDAPKGMSKEQFHKATQNMIALQLLYAAGTQPEPSDELNNFMTDRKIITSHDDLRSMWFQVGSYLATKEGQMAYLAWYANGGKNTTIPNAPSDLIETSVGLHYGRPDDKVGPFKDAQRMFTGFSDDMAEHALRNPVTAGAGAAYLTGKAIYNAFLDTPDPIKAYELGRAVSFFYNGATTGNKMAVGVDSALNAEVNGGIPVKTLELTAKERAPHWYLTATVEPGHAEGEFSHGNGFKEDWGLYGGWHNVAVTSYDDKTNHLKPEVWNELWENILWPGILSGEIKTILTNRPELVEGIDERSKDPAFEMCRKATNKKGEKVFVWDNSGNHYDHIDVARYYQKYDTKTGKEVTEPSDVVKHRAAANIYGNVKGTVSVSEKECKAGVKYFWNYEPNEKDAQRCGVPLKILKNNRILATQAGVVTYGMLKSAMSDPGLAAMAMHPEAKFILIPTARSSEQLKEGIVTNFLLPTEVRHFIPIAGQGFMAVKGATKIQKVNKNGDRLFTSDDILDRNLMGGYTRGAYRFVLDPTLPNNVRKEIEQFALDFNDIAKIMAPAQSTIPGKVQKKVGEWAGFYKGRAEQMVNDVKKGNKSKKYSPVEL